MTSWDEHIFTTEVNADFLDELAELDEDGIVDAVRDAVIAAASGQAAGDEEDNGLAAATIAAIWAGAPFSAGDIITEYPFIRGLAGSGDEELNDKALELLDSVDDDVDLEAFIEALS